METLDTPPLADGGDFLIASTILPSTDDGKEIIDHDVMDGRIVDNYHKYSWKFNENQLNIWCDIVENNHVLKVI